jgi:ADP-dependent NAD(P)H-hydrate dehydratase / NAD(P)H-hydrate epimerase
MKVSTVAQMRALDARASSEYGIPEIILMENAGAAACHVLRREVGVGGRTFTVVCGAGNNGGDGLVAARHLHANGGHVVVHILGDPARYGGAARTNYDIATRLPIEVRATAPGATIRADLARADVVVDAIFGTGITRPVAGVQRDVIGWINDCGQAVLSLDIPSGVSGDTGEVMGAAVRARWTVTFGLPKIGNVVPPGAELCGRLYVSHISFPPEMRETGDLAEVVDAATVVEVI